MYDFYEKFGNELIGFIKEKFDGELKNPSDLKEYEHQSVWIDQNINIRLTQWVGKPFYIIVYYGEEYKFEFDLTLVIEKNGFFTWYLHEPKNKDNKKLLKKYKNVVLVKLPDQYREEVRTIKRQIHGGTRVWTEGYLLCENDPIERLKENFFELLEKVIELLRKPDAIEGQYQEYILTKAKRNQNIVLKRKEFDKNTCQVCGFFQKIDDGFIIDCHHLKPLSQNEIRITSIDDLICLCPNCHRIAHTKNPPLTIEEIKRVKIQSGENK